MNELLNSQELWFLFCLYAPVIVPGFPDPTLGLLTNEVDEVRRQVGETLLGRGVIKDNAHGQWIILEPVAGWIRSIAAAQHTVIALRHDAGSEALSRSYHFYDDQVIALCSDGRDQYAIVPMQTTCDVQEFLLEPFLMSVYDEKCEEPLIIPAKKLAAALAQVEKQRLSLARATLKNEILCQELRRRFLHALTAPRTRLSLVMFLGRGQAGTNETKGFSIIAGEEDIWLLKPASDTLTHVVIKSISRIELENMIASDVPRLEAA